MLTSRRNFLGLLAAPAIVRASSLMKVVALPEVDLMPALSQSAAYHAAVRRQLTKEVLPLIQRHLVVHQFGRKMNFDAATAWTATRYNRMPLL